MLKVNRRMILGIPVPSSGSPRGNSDWIYPLRSLPRCVAGLKERLFQIKSVANPALVKCDTDPGRDKLS